ncbi:MAG: DUF3368 domain-containing protein [Methanothrix sp.]
MIFRLLEKCWADDSCMQFYAANCVGKDQVYDEVVRRGGGLAGASEVAACTWIRTGQRPSCFTGTIGVLLLASHEGMLDLKSALDELKAVGFRLSDKEYEKILSLSTCPPRRTGGPARV